MRSEEDNDDPDEYHKSTENWNKRKPNELGGYQGSIDLSKFYQSSSKFKNS